MLPNKLEEITCKWVQNIALAPRYPGTELTDVRQSTVISGSATKVFLELDYAPGGNPAELPATMVLKGEFETHGLAAGAQIPEVRFFQDIAPRLPEAVGSRTPKVFYAEAGVETKQGLILMENLAECGTQFGDPVKPESVDMVRRGVELLAELHAFWWDAEPLREIKWLGKGGILSTGNLLDYMLSPEHWAKCMALPRAQNFKGPLTDRRLFRAAVRRMYELDAASVHCLQHGDPHLGNWYFQGEGKPCLLDWQTIMAGPWAHDFTYFVIGSLTPEDRRTHERSLLRHYLDHLKAAGVSAPSEDEAWLDYRRHIMHGLMWVLNPPQMQPEPVSIASAERFIAAAEDHDPVEALGCDAAEGSPFEFISVEKDGPVTVITIDRPHALNALHPPACLEMCEALDAFEADPDSWVAILTGKGDRAFCTGDDLRWTAQHGREAQVEAFREILPRGGFGGMTHRVTRKPIIAALNGTAVGGGLEIALNCDIIIAAENAKLGLVEGKVGYIAAGGGVARLVRKIPHNVAMGMILTARQVEAAEAAKWGLANEVVPTGEALDAARRFAAAIMMTAPLSQQASKELARLALSEPAEACLPNPLAPNAQERFPATMKVLTSEDAMEGPVAFVEKRAAKWAGR